MVKKLSFCPLRTCEFGVKRSNQSQNDLRKAHNSPQDELNWGTKRRRDYLRNLCDTEICGGQWREFVISVEALLTCDAPSVHHRISELFETTVRF